jgi:uncharacterized alkaline shock family protein YloU
MAENKQYVTQVQDNGTVNISEEVIGTIVGHAVKDVEGVIGLTAKPGAEIIELIGKKNWSKGMKITIGEDDSICVDCQIVIAYGHSVVTVAQNVQNAISSALESMIGIRVSAVNVNVCGISRQ